MNKYQEALNEIIGIDYEYIRGQDKNIDLIQELVDKATPMKPIIDIFGVALCPNCKTGNIVSEESSYELDHCTECGQEIDWSKEDHAS